MRLSAWIETELATAELITGSCFREHSLRFSA